MRIMFVNAADLSDCSAGPVVHILEMARGLVHHGVDVDMVCPKPQADPLIETGGIHLHWCEARRFEMGQLIMRAVHQLRRPRPDVLYFRADWRLSPVCMAARRLGIPFVVECNGIPLLESAVWRNLFKAPWLRAADRWVYRHAHLVLPVTKELADFVATEYGVPASRIHVVPNGVNTDLYRPSERRSSVDGHGISNLSIGYMGAFRPWQGLHVLVQAVPHLVREFPDVTVLVAGSGPSAEPLKQMAKDLKVDNHIVWLGPVSYRETADFLSACDVAVAPFLNSPRIQKTGASPLKVLAYMSCGKPFVTSDIPALEWLRPVESCLMCRPEDPIDLAEKCIQLLRLSPRERVALGMRGRRVARTQFDWRILAGRVVALLETRVCRQSNLSMTH